MQPHRERVVEEKRDLDEKIEKLTTFLSDDEKRSLVTDAEQDRMQRQLDCMNAYSGILAERIDAFGESVPDTAEDDTDPAEEE